METACEWVRENFGGKGKKIGGNLLLSPAYKVIIYYNSFLVLLDFTVKKSGFSCSEYRFFSVMFRPLYK